MAKKTSVRHKQPDQRMVRDELLSHLEKHQEEKLFIGIDPGTHGAFGFVTATISAVLDIPTVVQTVGKKDRRTYDFVEIWRLLSAFLDLAEQNRLFVLLEKASPNAGGVRKDTPMTAFTTGVGGYMYHLLFVSKEVPFDTVPPATWKKHMGLTGKDKAASRVKAQMLFPKAPLWRVEDHNRAEALLLALYASRTR